MCYLPVLGFVKMVEMNVSLLAVVVAQSLALTIKTDEKSINLFDVFRKKRNISEYDRAHTISDREAGEMLDMATELKNKVESWIRLNHPELI